MTVTLKTCTKCGQAKPTTEYHRHKQTADGHVGHCKDCNAEYYRNYHRARKYGVTVQTLQELLTDQANTCSICEGEITIMNVVVDHDHGCCAGDMTCGKCVRGLLCNRCNRGLGFFKDSLSLLAAATQYLTEPPLAGGEYTPTRRQKV